MLGRLEPAGGWSHTAKHIPVVQDTFLADGFSRWPREMLAGKVRELTHSSDSREQSIGPRGSGGFNIVPEKEHHTKTRRRFTDAQYERSGRTWLTRAPFMTHAR